MFRLFLVLLIITGISAYSGNDSHNFKQSELLKFKRELNEDASSDENIEESSEETPPVLPNYESKGEWAKGNIPNKKIELGFVPFKSYAQIRKYNTVKHLPQSAALEEATTSEEARNAPRLREVLSHKKIQQVYEEEGYEDLGYDHAGYNHHGEKYESSEKEDNAEYAKVEKETDGSDESDSDTQKSAEETKVHILAAPLSLPISSWKSRKTETNQKIVSLGEDEKKIEEKEPQVENIDAKYLIVDGNKVPIYKTTVKTGTENQSIADKESLETAESKNGFQGRNIEGRVVNDPNQALNQGIKFPGRYTKRQYAMPVMASDVFVQETVAYPVNRPIYHYIAPNYPNYYSESPSYPPAVRIQYRTKRPNINTKTGPVQFADSAAAVTIVSELNETTTTTTTSPPTTSTTPLPLNSTDSYLDVIQPRHNQSEFRHYKSVRKYNIFKRNPNVQHHDSWAYSKPLLNARHPSMPKDANIITNTESLGPVKYIEQLTMASYNTGQAYPTSYSQDVGDRLVELAKQLNEGVSNKHRNLRKKRDIIYDKNKYPFYKARHRNRNSALRYATNPVLIPKKTEGGMEFYESRDELKCNDPEPPKDVVPEHEDGEWKTSQPDLPRLKNLGDNIDCFKQKYFGKEPLDNPFFQEEFNESTKRLMVIPRIENNTRLVYNYTSDPNAISQKIVYDNPLPYKNHRPETTVPPFIQYPDYYPEDTNVEGSKRHKHYYPKIKHKYKKKRYRVVQRRPVSIYSIISNGHPSYYRPLVFAHSVDNHQFLPIIEALETQSPDSIASDSQTAYNTNKPTKFYIVRPGEYTENPEIASEKKEATSIWSYMNPLKWWFPSLFDNRRKEPRYRKKRSAENHTIPYNHKPEIKGISDIQNKINSRRTRFNRLTGGYITRDVESTEPTTRSVVAPTMQTQHTNKTVTPKMTTNEKKNRFDFVPIKNKKPIDHEQVVPVEHRKLTEDLYNKYLQKNGNENKKMLTYIVDPITGFGTWDEVPKKRKHRKRMGNYNKFYNYPEESRFEQDGTRSRSLKKQRDIQNYDRGREAYILGLLAKVPPFYSRQYNRKPRHKAEEEEEEEEEEEITPENDEYDSVEKADEEYYAEPTKSPPKYIKEPNKRKYYYVRV